MHPAQRTIRKHKFYYTFNFYRQPAWLQVLFKKMQISVDKYCRINKAGDIIYTVKHDPNHNRVLTVAESKRIFTDLYGEPAS